MRKDFKNYSNFLKQAGEQCNSFLEGRVQWDNNWNVYDKMQWCRDTIDYVNCAEQFLINCDITFVRNEADQLQSFIDYITKLSNINCPGGIKGCENSTGDMRCILGVRYFTGEYNFNSAEKSKSNRAMFMYTFLVVFILKIFYFV